MLDAGQEAPLDHIGPLVGQKEDFVSEQERVVSEGEP